VSVLPLASSSYANGWVLQVSRGRGGWLPRGCCAAGPWPRHDGFEVVASPPHPKATSRVVRDDRAWAATMPERSTPSRRGSVA